MRTSPEQQTITVTRRLRPIRLAFLVPSSDARTLRRVIQVNTCLWGGRFNPIIPFFRRTPPPLIEGRDRPPARSIVQGYLAGFSPDYLVVEDKTKIGRLTFPQNRIIELAEVLQPKDDQPIGFGLDVSYVYGELYEKEFKFQRRHPVQVILPRLAPRSLSLFYATHFGEFPPELELTYLTRAYKEALGAAEQAIEPSQFFSLLFQYPLYPIKAGSLSLRVQNPDRETPQIFFMDATSPLDLMDYWNLKATGRQVVPMPAELADHSINELSAFISKNYVPHRHNKEWMLHTTIICSRSRRFEEMEAFTKKLQIPPHSLVLQRLYPRIWDEWARTEAREGIGSIAAQEDSVTSVSTHSRIHFPNLTPEFVNRVTTHRTPHWINVINLSQQGSLVGVPVIPPGLPDLNRVLQYSAGHPIWATEEGIVVPCVFWKDSQFWELPTPVSLFTAYMEQAGYQLEISSAGKITLQLLRALGSIWGVSSLGDEEVLRRLEAMAHGVAESEVSDTAGGQRQRIRAPTVSFRTWWGILQRANDGSAEIARNQLRNLLNSDVFRLGLRLQCPKCSQHTWFGLEQLAPELTCERCLQKFAFPMEPPSEDSWHYRTVGPFSIEGYAHGSYCALLASNFLFGHHLRGEATWVPAITLQNDKQEPKELEVDFAAFWRSEYSGQKAYPLLVLAECKTFDRFTDKDVRRMSILAERFPWAMIVFCTLRKQLEEREKRLIGSLARKGRRHLRAERWRNPVMVLTGVELLHRMGPSSCWEKAGAPYSQYKDHYWRHRNSQDLCDMLQQMHLGLESYHTWYEQQWQRKHTRRAKAQTPAALTSNEGSV